MTSEWKNIYLKNERDGFAKSLLIKIDLVQFDQDSIFYCFAPQTLTPSIIQRPLLLAIENGKSVGIPATSPKLRSRSVPEPRN